MKDKLAQIKDLNIGKVEEDVSLAKYTTYKVGGVCRGIVFPKDTDCLITLIRFLKSENIPYKILGKGSNLLFSSKPYEGILIKLDEFNNVKFFGKTKIQVEAGFPLIKLSMMAAKKGLTGLEFASGIPGSVGGAVFMKCKKSYVKRLNRAGFKAITFCEIF